MCFRVNNTLVFNSSLYDPLSCVNVRKYQKELCLWYSYFISCAIIALKISIKWKLFVPFQWTVVKFYTHTISNLKEQLPNENDLKFSFHIEQQKRPLFSIDWMLHLIFAYELKWNSCREFRAIFFRHKIKFAWTAYVTCFKTFISYSMEIIFVVCIDWRKKIGQFPCQTYMASICIDCSNKKKKIQVKLTWNYRSLQRTEKIVQYAKTHSCHSIICK